MFELHPQLIADTVELGKFPLSTLLLMNDSQYPWCILVPMRDDIREIYQLTEEDQQQLQKESSLLGQALMKTFAGDKLNIAALGNMVPQLHVHHIVRYTTDIAWPKPVWGQQPPLPYDEPALRERESRIKDVLQGTIFQGR